MLHLKLGSVCFPIFKTFRVLRIYLNIFGANICSDICLKALSVPQRSKFSLSYAMGNCSLLGQISVDKYPSIE